MHLANAFLIFFNNTFKIIFIHAIGCFPPQSSSTFSSERGMIAIAMTIINLEHTKIRLSGEQTTNRLFPCPTYNPLSYKVLAAVQLQCINYNNRMNNDDNNNDIIVIVIITIIISLWGKGENAGDQHLSFSYNVFYFS